MVDHIDFQAGEFTTRIRFLTDMTQLLEGSDLAVFDTNTQGLFAALPARSVVWPAGEEHKTWPQIETVLKTALEAGLARDSVFLGVGGGVVTDMAAFASSLYMRGARLVLAPTSLLAMVDAAIGGKTGIDYGSYKNMVGSFYPANEIRICPAVLRSLPQREYLGGLAEVIKHAMLGEPELWNLLVNRREEVLARSATVLNELVFRSVMVKVGVVERDFREQGERAFLNLGHTFAHGLESVTGMDGSWTHGEAVAWGLVRALDLGVTLGLTDPGYLKEVTDLLTAYGYRLQAGAVEPQALLAAMKKDKKKKGGEVRFVLQKKRGESFQQAVPDPVVLGVLNRGL